MTEPAAGRNPRSRTVRAVELAVVVLMVATGTAGLWSRDDPGAVEENKRNGTTTTEPTHLVEIGVGPRGPTPAQTKFAADPPNIKVASRSDTVEVLSATCAGGGDCGMPGPEHPLPTIGNVDAGFDIGFPLDGWTFTATYMPENVVFSNCMGRSRTAEVEPTSARYSWHVRPAGPAGRYSVSVDGHGPEGWAQGWVNVETTSQGTEPPIHVDLGGPSGTPETPETIWLYVSLQNLATDINPSGEVTWTAENGRSDSVTIAPPPFPDGPDCEGDGAVHLRSSESDAQALLTLGPPPFTLEFRLTIDGRRYSTTVVWPDDLDARTGSLNAEFWPPLPALRGV